MMYEETPVGFGIFHKITGAPIKTGYTNRIAKIYDTPQRALGVLTRIRRRDKEDYEVKAVYIKKELPND